LYRFQEVWLPPFIEHRGFGFFADGDSDGMIIEILEGRKNGNCFDTVPQAKLGDC
jgi:hypothetical protein